MLRELTITVDDTVYQTLKPMVEQQTIGTLLSDFLQYRPQERRGAAAPSIKALRGTLHRVNTSDLREEADRPL